jgi:4-alpha-glucanotransferase
MFFSLDERASGILLHPTSLPGPYGNGDLGTEAHRFAAQLAETGQRVWQMLPVGPAGLGNSPYSARSAFAGNPLLVDLEDLAERGWLPRDLGPPRFPVERVDYDRARAFRWSRLEHACESFRKRRRPAGFDDFRERERSWLADYALYSALKDATGGAEWIEWPRELRLRRRGALARARRELAERIELHEFVQWMFDEQWRSLKRECERLGVLLMGDVPIFVAYDSADVWAHRDLFTLDEEGRPEVVAGIPPDFFSKTGQRWGNPHYRWDRISRTGYRFWLDRFASGLSRFDALRLDHFIGYYRVWHVPADEPTALNGRWSPGPREALFEALRREHGDLPLVAEDLGLVIPEVRALRDRFGLPGMKLLQFAFGTDLQAQDFLPHNFPRRAVAYTGTHDNDTIVGWFRDPGGKGKPRSRSQARKEREGVLAYLGTDGRDIHWAAIRCLWASVANLAIVPMQDVLGLDSRARMNSPGTGTGNWEWRMRSGAFSRRVRARLAALTRIYGRWPLPARASRSEERAEEAHA